MSKELVSYRHDLGTGLYLDAFALDPKIDEKGLVKIVKSLDGKANPDLDALSRTIIRTDYVDSIKGLKLIPVDESYSVPKPIKPYRAAVEKDWISRGKKNGPIIIATGEIRIPLNVIQGYYCDFLSTKLTDQPAKLLPEVYQEGKTVEDILNENGISIEERARYLGFAHLMSPSNGEEFLLVQRAKGMGIAEDCISTPGSTPDIVLSNPGLKKPGFGINEYWSYHFAEEMKDEFHLRWGDFWTEDIYFFDDKKSIPFGAIKISTNLSTKEIAEKAYGDPRVLQEHTLLYSMNPEVIPVFLQRFPIFPSVARTLDIILKEK